MGRSMTIFGLKNCNKIVGPTTEYYSQLRNTIKMQSSVVKSTMFFSQFGDITADPRPEDLTLEEAAATVIGFGQHKGETIGHLVRKPDGRDYLRYLKKWPELKRATCNAITRMLDAFDEYQEGVRVQKEAIAAAEHKECESHYGH